MREKKDKPKSMKKDVSPPGEPAAPPEEDDSVEILEVVGMNEGEAPLSPTAAGAPPSPAPGDSIPYTREQLYDMLLRKQADFENARKRLEREREESQRRMGMDLLGRLLPILDNFQRALSAGPPGDSPDPFREGVSMTLQQMKEILAREGLEEIPSVGEPFDPHVHEAVETQVVEGLEEGIVLEEMRKGYRFRGQLLRPALVRVSAKG